MQIIVIVKSNYGREALYPANHAAQVLASIVGSKTLSRETLKLATDLGHTVVATTPEFKL